MLNGVNHLFTFLVTGLVIIKSDSFSCQTLKVKTSNIKKKSFLKQVSYIFALQMAQRAPIRLIREKYTFPQERCDNGSIWTAHLEDTSIAYLHKGRAIAQGISPTPLTSEVWGRSQTSLWDLW